MAERFYAAASFAGDAVTCNLIFDDITLNILRVDYTNTTDRPVGAVVRGPAGFTHTYIWPALGTAPNTGNGSGTNDLSGLGLKMTATAGVNAKTGVPGTSWGLPTGWTVNFQYPAG